MHMSIAALLGAILAASEIGLALFKRAKSSHSAAADRGSLRLLWIVIVVSIGCAYRVRWLAPAFGLSPSPAISTAALVLFIGGLALRWYAIVYLGRYFTVDVAIAADHRVVDTGPYTYIRHPSYTGLLLEFTAMAVALCNWASLAVMMIPITLAFLWRIHVEENALTQALGAAYRDYARRTKRLLPAIY
jgi:protein-S-isoprenylcysteine O-methyltransferase